MLLDSQSVIKKSDGSVQIVYKNFSDVALKKNQTLSEVVN